MTLFFDVKNEQVNDILLVSKTLKITNILKPDREKEKFTFLIYFLKAEH